MRKIICYIAVSLDGYIATEEGNLEWLMAISGEGDNGFKAFYDTIDTILIGRKTFEHLVELVGGTYPHTDKTTYIFTRQIAYKLDKSQSGQDTHVEHGQSFDWLRKRRHEDGKDIWLVGGSELIAVLESEGLIDEMIITYAPVRLGRGIPLWRESARHVMTSWQLIGHRMYGQFVQVHYRSKGA